MIKAICTMMPYVKTALKGVRMERAERVLDVTYNSSGKKKENSGGGSSPIDNDDHVGL